MFSALWSWNELNGNRPSLGNGNPKEAKPIKIEGRDLIWSVAFIDDEKHVVSSGKEGKIRRWRVEDGTAVGPPIDPGASVIDVAVSHDGKYIVSGADSGDITVWNAERCSKVVGFKAHRSWVRAVDVSQDGTTIATGSDDKTACIWSLSTGERLLGPLEHDDWVVAAKFSPYSGHQLVATATYGRGPVRVYDAQDGRLLAQFSVQVYSAINQSVVWAGDGKQLFVLSRDGNIHRLDVSTGTTTNQWPIHSSNRPSCIALAGNGKFIATSASSLVSFWDTGTCEQVGSVIECTHDVWSMALSATKDIVLGGETKITLHGLGEVLPSHYFDSTACERKVKRADDEKVDHEAVRGPLRSQVNSSDEKVANFRKTIEELRLLLSETQQKAKQEKDDLIQSLRAQEEDSHIKIAQLEETVGLLNAQLAESRRKAEQEKGELIRILEQRHKCEVLFGVGRIVDAAVSLLAIVNAVDESGRADKFIVDWLTEFTPQCVMALEGVGDQASNAEKPDEAVTAYATALSLSPSAPNTVLYKWARMALNHGSTHEALIAATKFRLPKFVICRVVCDMLEGDDRVEEAVEYFQQMQDQLYEDASTNHVREQWELDFRTRCVGKLEDQGDRAKNSKNYDVAIQRYSNALTFQPMNQRDILLKRSEARALKGSWVEVLEDADRIIELDPSSHMGYETKHAALHRMKRYSEAFEAFEVMLSKLEQSADPLIRGLRHGFIDATPTIQRVVEDTIRHTPRELINTATGRLYDKIQQAKAFEEFPIYDKLRSSMTTRTQLNLARIRKEVKKFYRYVMFSHRWQPNEPTFQQVEKISIYHLSASPANNKLQNFCKIVRTLRFKWAWSDTCCVNQLDKGVQQESLVAMFRWYRGSSLTVVHLLGVLSESQEFGRLWRSVWNTRGWTYQEYIASGVVQFYTEDWKPYLGLDIFNHKQSPLILSEMEQAMKFARQELATLQPGLDRVREKLFLASTRQTTREEDMAYSLFGIFNVALPIIYGEGNHAVGRLLEYILTRSDNVTLLAWTGKSGSHHSYLPAELAVYNHITPIHIPPPVQETEMGGMVTSLRSSFPDLSLAIALYERLHDLPPLSLVAGRLRLPGIVFPLVDLVLFPDSESNSGLHVYRAASSTLGDVEIKSTDDLSGMEGLLLIHPWISPLIDQDFSRGAALFDLDARALRLLVRLRQRFGALLLAPLGRVQYRRVATDSLIMVQVREETSLIDLMDGIRTVDVQ